MKMRGDIICFIAFLFLMSPSVLIAQIDSTHEKIYDGWFDGVYCLPSNDSTDFVYYDSIDNKPVNGWIISRFKKRLYVNHYNCGLRDGFSADYKKYKGEFHIIGAHYWQENNLIQAMTFRPNLQISDSLKRIYGLTKIIDYKPDYYSDNCKITNRTVKFLARKTLIIDKYYFGEIGRFKEIKYNKTGQAPLLDYKYLYQLTETYPRVLGSDLNPLSFIKVDGFYACFIHHHGDEKLAFSIFLKFYPNNMVRFKFMNGKQTEFSDWNKVDASPYHIVDNELSFNVSGTEVSFQKGKVYDQFILMETRFYKFGVNNRFMFDYIALSKKNRL